MEILSLADIGFQGEIPEDHETLQENAIQKAEYIASRFSVNCFADDTGLEIDALDGRPGVYSARYAGTQRSADDNMNRVLTEMQGLDDRAAKFRTVVALIMDGTTHIFEGEVKGVILKQKTGTHGFGYDPIFSPNGYSKSFAQMTMEEKNTVSHRARAVAKLVEFVTQERASS